MAGGRIMKLGFVVVFFAAALFPTVEAWARCSNTPVYVALYPPYRGLKAGALQVSGNWPLEEAVKCHDTEEACAKEKLEKGEINLESDSGRAQVAAEVETYKAYYKLYPPAIRTDFIVKLLSDKIRRRLFPYLDANADGQIPDLQVFKAYDDSDREYLKAFMQEPDHLLISVQTAFFFHKSAGEIALPLSPGAADNVRRYGPASAVLTMHILRSDSFVTYAWGGIGEARQLAIPLDLSENEIEDRVRLFLDNFLPNVGPSADGEPSQASVQKHHEEVLSKKPPVPTLTQCR